MMMPLRTTCLRWSPPRGFSTRTPSESGDDPVAPVAALSYSGAASYSSAEAGSSCSSAGLLAGLGIGWPGLLSPTVSLGANGFHDGALFGRSLGGLPLSWSLAAGGTAHLGLSDAVER